MVAHGGRASRGDRRVAGLVATTALLLAGCGDLGAPYTAELRGDPPTANRLTYSAGNRAPVWLGNDTIVYAAAGYPPFPAWGAIPMLLPRAKGAAAPIFPDVLALPASLTFLTPVAAPAGDRVAYVRPEDIQLLGPPGPPLAAARLSVRRRGVPGELTADPTLAISFPGARTLDPTLNIPGAGSLAKFRERYYPFQARYGAHLALAFRPAWSPDGGRLVFSDGLRLLMWTPGDAAAVPVVGGENGFSAAWSPHGDYIAFVRPVILDSATVDRIDYKDSVPFQARRTTTYREGPAHVLLLPLAGGAARDLGEGEEPAWAPDASSLYVARADGTIARIPVGGGAAVAVAGVDPGAVAAQDPAISPDGRWLVYTRGDDLWLLSLTP